MYAAFLIAGSLLISPQYSWDDWVPSDRLRKFTDENKQLAQSLKGQMDDLRRASAPKSTKKKAADSDLSSTLGSEDRQMSVIGTGRGQKRGRDYEIEKVGQISSFLILIFLGGLALSPFGRNTEVCCGYSGMLREVSWLLLHIC